MDTEKGIIPTTFAKLSTIAPTKLGSISQRKPFHLPQAGHQALSVHPGATELPLNSTNRGT